jgi:acetyl esterase/lipase
MGRGRDPIAAGAARHLTVLYLHGGGFIGLLGAHPPAADGVDRAAGRAPVRAGLPARARASVPGRDRRCLRGLAGAARRRHPDADGLTVAGDSAGGNLALALMLVCATGRANACPTRRRCSRPGTDLTGTQPVSRRNAGRDVLFDRAAIEPGRRDRTSPALIRSSRSPRRCSATCAACRRCSCMSVPTSCCATIRCGSPKARAAGVAVELKVWPSCRTSGR